MPSSTPNVAVIPAAVTNHRPRCKFSFLIENTLGRKKRHLPEEQRLNRIIVELGVVNGAAVRLDDRDGVDQRGGSRLNQIKGNGVFVHTE